MKNAVVVVAVVILVLFVAVESAVACYYRLLALVR